MKTRMVLSCVAAATVLAAAPATAAASTAGKSASPTASKRDTTAVKELKDATLVINKMKMDKKVSDLLKRSKGAFLIPSYGRAGIVGGGAGDEGLLLAHYHGDWSDPVFYKVHAVNSGARTDISGGRIAMILMTDKAINRFKKQNSFSLNAGTSLTILDYSKGGQLSGANADIVLWSDTNRAAGSGSLINPSNISADENANRAFYGGRYGSPRAILSGVSESRPAATALRHDLPA